MSRNDKARTLRIRESTWQNLARMGRFGMTADELICELLSKVEAAQMPTPLRMVER